MAKKIERVYRDRPLTATEAARDAEVRGQVKAEFPRAIRSASQTVISSEDRATFSSILRRSIQESGKSLETIAHESGLPRTLIDRFLAGERDIHVASADRLAESLGLKLTAS